MVDREDFLLYGKKGSFDLYFSVVGEGFVGIKVRWKGSVLFFVNTYSSCSLLLKRKLWSELIDCKRNVFGGK